MFRISLEVFHSLVSLFLFSLSLYLSIGLDAARLFPLSLALDFSLSFCTIPNVNLCALQKKNVSLFFLLFTIHLRLWSVVITITDDHENTGGICFASILSIGCICQGGLLERSRREGEDRSNDPRHHHHRPCSPASPRMRICHVLGKRLPLFSPPICRSQAQALSPRSSGPCHALSFQGGGEARRRR